MSSELFEITIPSLGFFIAFFLGYLLLEMAVVAVLNRIIFSYWGLVTVPDDYPTLKRNRRIETGVMLFISISTIGFTLWSRVVEALLISKIGTRLFALEAFLGMILIYSITTHQLVKDDFIKKVHKYLYFYLSAIVFVAVTLAVDQNFDRFQTYLRTQIIAPIQTQHAQLMEERLQEELLVAFRHKIFNHKCPPVDFSTPEKIGNVNNLVYIATHSDLALDPTPFVPNNPMEFLKGWLCEDPRGNFLLTKYGQWYWITTSS